MERRAFLAGIGAGAAVASAGCLSLNTGTSGGGTDEIQMNSNEFLPERYEASVGERVVWNNTSTRPHTVTSGVPDPDHEADSLPEGASYFSSGGFDSEAAAERAWQNDLKGAIEPGTTYSHTFEVAGTYPYYCIPHQAAGMTGVIVVKD